MTRGFFISGTDTGVGKTTYTAHLLRRYRQQGFTSIGLKPVASGCFETLDGLRSEDALLLQQYANPMLSYEQINPFAFAEPVAPHLAAQKARRHLSVNKILKKLQPTLTAHIDFILVEGCGGWLVPLNANETFADLAQALNFPVILVVAMRLGCLNHALLSAASIQAHGLTLAGWVANLFDPNMALLQENILTLQNNITAPLLDIITTT